MRSALRVMKAVQSSSFLVSSQFSQLQRIAGVERPAPSMINGAGMGLFAGRPADAGEVISLYPVHGIGRDNHFADGQAAFLAADEHGDYFDTSEVPAYRQYLLGERSLLFLPASSSAPIFIDCNPNAPLVPGWRGSLVNDGAACTGGSEAEVVRYYVESKRTKNCALVPFGPAPLMAYVTTRRVEAGEEFSTTYGADFWLAGAPLELTPSINLLVRELATCLHTTAQAVAASYAPDLRILTALFERSSKRR